MNFDILLQFKLGGSTQSFAENVFLDFELVFVAGVLVMAAATTREVNAAGLDSMGRLLCDSIGCSTHKTRFLFGNGGVDLFSGENERNECGFAASTLIGGQVG